MVPDSVRTSGKDEVAAYIQEEIIEQDRWPVDMTTIAEETGYTRQHIANTLKDYFERVDGPRGVVGPLDETVDTEPHHMDIEIPVAADDRSYLWGYLQGWLDGQTES